MQELELDHAKYIADPAYRRLTLGALAQRTRGRRVSELTVIHDRHCCQCESWEKTSRGIHGALAASGLAGRSLRVAWVEPMPTVD